MLSLMEKMRPWIAASIVFSCLVLGLAGVAGAADEKTLDRLEQIIQQQQAQIEAQQKALEQLQGEVQTLKGQRRPRWRWRLRWRRPRTARWPSSPATPRPT